MKGLSTGMLLLGIWLVLSGLIPILNIHFNYMGLLMNVLALISGVLILLRR